MSIMSPPELLPIPPIETATDPDALGYRPAPEMACPDGPARIWATAPVGRVRRTRPLHDQGDQPGATGVHRQRRSLPNQSCRRLHDVLTDFATGTTVAFLLTRPGTGPISHLDRQWSVLLTELAGDHGIPIEQIFRANDDSLVLVEPEMSAAT